MAGIDTVKLTLTGDECRADYMKETPRLLEGVEWKQGIRQGQEYEQYFGRAGNMLVQVEKWGVVVKNSLARYYLGDNLQTLTRGAVRDAVGKLSDELHLPMELARVGRCDIGANLITKHAPFMYYQYMGQLARYKRMEMDMEGVMYRTMAGTQEFLLYNKTMEVTAKGGEIPPLYQGRNVLRLERRTMKLNRRTAGRFGVFQVLGRTLYDENFYMALMKDYKATYDNIAKTNGKIEIECNMKKVSDLMKIGAFWFIQSKMGGFVAFGEWLEGERKAGNITSKQKSDLMEKAKELEGISAGVEVEGCINELDGLIKRDLAFFP